MKFSLFDVVSLAQDLPEYSFKAGLIGTVIDVYSVPDEAYEIEFCDEQGRTIGMLALLPEQLSKT